MAVQTGRRGRSPASTLEINGTYSHWDEIPKKQAWQEEEEAKEELPEPNPEERQDLEGVK